jgi:hypothetical protein
MANMFRIGQRVVRNGVLPAWIVEQIEPGGLRYMIYQLGSASFTDWAHEDELEPAKEPSSYW